MESYDSFIDHPMLPFSHNKMMDQLKREMLQITITVVFGNLETIFHLVMLLIFDNYVRYVQD